MKSEMYITKEELIQYLNDHEIKSIRIVAESNDPSTHTMIDIISTGKKEKDPLTYYEWETDSTIDYSKIIDVQDEKEEGVKKD